MSSYPSQPFPYLIPAGFQLDFSLLDSLPDSSCISVFAVHPHGARELCPDRSFSKTFGNFTITASWAHVQFSIEVNPKAVKIRGDREHRAKNKPFPAVWRMFEGVSAGSMWFQPVEFPLLTPRRFFPVQSVPGAARHWPLWAQRSWVPFPATLDVSVCSEWYWNFTKKQRTDFRTCSLGIKVLLQHQGSRQAILL